jgi:hypothetical protein
MNFHPFIMTVVLLAEPRDKIAEPDNTDFIYVNSELFKLSTDPF